MPEQADRRRFIFLSTLLALSFAYSFDRFVALFSELFGVVERWSLPISRRIVAQCWLSE